MPNHHYSYCIVGMGRQYNGIPMMTDDLFLENVLFSLEPIGYRLFVYDGSVKQPLGLQL